MGLRKISKVTDFLGKDRKNVMKSYDFMTFLVEISGIEPLTS